MAVWESKYVSYLLIVCRLYIPPSVDVAFVDFLYTIQRGCFCMFLWFLLFVRSPSVSVLYLYVHVYVFLFFVFVRIFACVYFCACVCVCVSVSVLVFVCFTRAYAHSHSCVYVICIYMCMYVCVFRVILDSFAAGCMRCPLGAAGGGNDPCGCWIAPVLQARGREDPWLGDGESCVRRGSLPQLPALHR